MVRTLFITIIISGALFFSAGCSRNSYENDFSKPVFIEDATNPGLPQYSELGYNTFGAYYNSKVWASSKANSYSEIAFTGIKDDSLCLYTNGMVDNLQNVKAALLITKTKINELTDLVKLHNRTFDLKGDSVKLKIDSVIVNIQSGNFNFRKSRQLIVGDKLIGMILSGTFEIKGTANGNPVELRNGRFDILIKSSTLRNWMGF